MTYPADTHPHLDRVVEQLAVTGFSITPGFIPEAEIEKLRLECVALQQQGFMDHAEIGKNAGSQDEIRGDLVHRLDATSASESQRNYLAMLEILRQKTNHKLHLGLCDFEGHFALFPPGSFYRKHLDQFNGNQQRTLTCILYLNPNWVAEDGGELRLYLGDRQRGSAHLDTLPQGGTLVCFLSGRYWHEVLPARRKRASVTGWFCTRSATTS
jgi:SM-20-related protein